MQGCKNTFVEFLFRIGVGLIVVAVIVFIMILLNSAPQTSEDVTGDTIHIVEFLYMIVVALVGDPILAAVVVLVAGVITIALALAMDSQMNPRAVPKQRQARK